MAIRIENRLGFNFGRPLGANALYTNTGTRYTEYDNDYIVYEYAGGNTGTQANPVDITSKVNSIINAGKVNLITILQGSAYYETYYKFTLPSDIGCYHVEMDQDAQVSAFRYLIGIDKYLNFLGAYKLFTKPNDRDYLISSSMTWYPPGSTVVGSTYYWDAEDDYTQSQNHILLAGIPYFGKVV